MVQKASIIVLNNFFPLSFERETQGFPGSFENYTRTIFDGGEQKIILYKHCGTQSARLNLATDFWSGGNTTENLVIQAGSCPSSTLQWSELMLKLRSVWHSGAERIVFTIISWIYIIRQMFEIFWVFV